MLLADNSRNQASGGQMLNDNEVIGGRLSMYKKPLDENCKVLEATKSGRNSPGLEIRGGGGNGVEETLKGWKSKVLEARNWMKQSKTENPRSWT